MNDKIIIHNYTELNDVMIMNYISTVIQFGKISKCKYGDTYCFITRFPHSDKIVVSCDRKNNTYTFKIFKE